MDGRKKGQTVPFLIIDVSHLSCRRQGEVRVLGGQVTSAVGGGAGSRQSLPPAQRVEIMQIVLLNIE